MAYALMHGDLLSAVKFNALSLVILVLAVGAYVTWIYGRIVGRRIVGWQHYRWSSTVALVLLSGWFVVRNLPFAPFTGLYV
jgi:cell shape-determining protein MreD